MSKYQNTAYTFAGDTQSKGNASLNGTFRSFQETVKATRTPTPWYLAHLHEVTNEPQPKQRDYSSTAYSFSGDSEVGNQKESTLSTSFGSFQQEVENQRQANLQAPRQNNRW